MLPPYLSFHLRLSFSAASPVLVRRQPSRVCYRTAGELSRRGRRIVRSKCAWMTFTPLSLLLKYGTLFIAIAYIGLYLVLAWFRLSYPFELEWMEGGSVEHVRRLLVGQQIYVAPSLDFIPYPYPSFHYYVSAAAAQLFGLKLESLRLVKNPQLVHRSRGQVVDDLHDAPQPELVSSHAALDGVHVSDEVNVMRGPWPVPGHDIGLLRLYRVGMD